MIFLKFGKKEHLQQLKDGVVHFSPLSSFIGDSTNFRGDRLEGSLLMDLSHPLLINGVNFAPFIKEAIISYVGFDSILSFSAAMLNYKNCHMVEDGLFTPDDDFIEEMAQFGDYVLVFYAEDFISPLREKLKNHKCNCSYHPIFYCDKADHAAIAKHFADKRKSGFASDSYDYCFIKDITYSNQNEWRFIIHDTNNEFPIEDNSGVNIMTTFRTEMPIFESHLLKTLILSEEHLK